MGEQPRGLAGGEVGQVRAGDGQGDRRQRGGVGIGEVEGTVLGLEFRLERQQRPEPVDRFQRVNQYVEQSLPVSGGPAVE